MFIKNVDIKSLKKGDKKVRDLVTNKLIPIKDIMVPSVWAYTYKIHRKFKEDSIRRYISGREIPLIYFIFPIQKTKDSLLQRFLSLATLFQKGIDRELLLSFVEKHEYYKQYMNLFYTVKRKSNPVQLTVIDGEKK